KETVRLPPKNELDEGEQWTLLEIDGQARRYVVRGDKQGLPDGQPVRGEVGDLMLVCDGGAEPDRRLPPAWQGAPLTGHAFPARLAAPPLIARKARWSPRHITSTKFFWAIHDVKWKYGDQPVLANIEVGRDLGGGRYEIPSIQNLSWVLEVPESLRK